MPDKIISLIEQGNLKIALEKVFEFIRSINKYFDENAPWITVKENLEVCGNTIYNCIYSIANLANILSPFWLESLGKIKAWLDISEDRWETVEPRYGLSIEEVTILFERFDKKIIEEEKNKLLNCKSLSCERFQ